MMENGLPAGSWTHSFEEDADGIEVFRPSASFSFPPSRRPRRTLAFGADGQVGLGTPGPDDRLRHAQVALQALGANRFRLGDARVVDVVEAGPDVLKLKEI
ncbi:hypothetical protein HH212_04785 [Massilia forsythiae]|uniref:Uncharacterized protein n=1 Tax=Massilia forsythiae TaxID=2728020 RepID=A0A7Z2ZRF9_9BURK|nr:hypothetical protein [Massilia forsythiae]QJD99425.1 hypothetical protein HH212_04785 [Massilia forsythiae]